MNGAYKKECWSTIIAFFVVVFLSHIFPIYFLFPEITETTLFGFPTHYFLSVFCAWIVMLPVYWIYIQVSEGIDREIETSKQPAPSAFAGKTAPRASGGAE